MIMALMKAKSLGTEIDSRCHSRMALAFGFWEWINGALVFTEKYNAKGIADLEGKLRNSVLDIFNLG